MYDGVWEQREEGVLREDTLVFIEERNSQLHVKVHFNIMASTFRSLIFAQQWTAQHIHVSFKQRRPFATLDKWDY